MNAMDCNDIRALLSGLIDDTVDTKTRHAAERHLAECEACRAMISEAESLDGLLARALDDDESVPGLPDGFEQAVLAQTVHAGTMNAPTRRWITWTGWLAAAATLALAATIWMIDRTDRDAAERQREIAQATTDSGSGLVPVNYSPRTAQRSWVYDGDLPADPARGGDEAGIVSAAAPDSNGPKPEPVIIFSQPPVVGPSQTGRFDEAMMDQLNFLASRPTVAPDDADTLASTVQILESLRDADVRNFADVEFIRRVVEYDELLPRLAEARKRLPERDRPAVHAAESVLLRVVRGPLTLEEVREIRNDVASLDLAAQLDAITGGWNSLRSL